MARGGYRPGAGRPKGAKTRAEGKTAPLASGISCAARVMRMTPLEYMLSVLNDAEADSARRDRMAVAAAPYVHPKAETASPGKKKQAEAAAQTAEQGTSWETLLN